MGTSRLAWWERRTECPLAGLAAVFLAGYAVPILDVGLAALRRALPDSDRHE